jgi:small subunit ribosomal protein S4
MFNTREKRERSLGTKLFLKPHRCASQKCVTVRRPTRPGIHGKSRRRMPSEFGIQLQEKQKFQFTYGLRESQMRNTFKAALKNPGVTGEVLLSLFERRLDNVVYRLGFALSRSIARQSVGHGHILVNGRKVTIPSYRVRVGDVIAVREASQEIGIFKQLEETLKNFNLPQWLAHTDKKLTGKVLSLPQDFDLPFDVNLVVDYYSKVVK